MSRTIRTPLVTAALAAVVLVPATGCVSIPTDSAVQPGRSVGVQEEPRLISNVPPGPVPGDSREEVVTGFFAAMLAYPQSASIAREFLAPDAAKAWDPEADLVVYQDQEIIEQRERIAVTARKVGSLDDRGAWSSAKPERDGISADLRLARVRGEWRIVNPLPGTYVDFDYFDRYFAPFALHFLDPTRTVLTPDPVYLLLDETTATSLVSNLLRGPTKHLVGVATTAAPPQTEVDVAVSITPTGLAEVPLTGEALALSQENRLLLAAQLTWTLRQLVEIDEIAVTVDGNSLEVPGFGERFGVDEFDGYDPAGLAASRQLFALSAAGLVTVSESDVSPVLGSLQRTSRSASSAAVDPSGNLTALVGRAGQDVVVAAAAATAEGGPKKWFSGGADLLPPSWDVHQLSDGGQPSHLLWLVDRTRRGAVVYAVTQTGSRQVRAPGITGADVMSFAVSRDGVRLAAVVRRDGRPRLMISIIDRDAQRPARVSLSPAQEVISPEFSPSGVTGLAWASPTSVVLLADEGGERQPFEVSIDGSSAAETTGFIPVEPVSIAAGPNVDAPVAIGSKAGEIYVQTADLQWVQFGGSTRLYQPIYPG